MSTLKELEEKRKKEQKKFGSKGFKATSSKGTNVGGGGSPASAALASQVAKIEKDLATVSINEDLGDTISGLEDKSKALEQNLAALDTATSQFSGALSTLNSQVLDLSSTKADIGHDHPNQYLTATQVRSLILSLLGTTGVAPPPPPGNPTILTGQYGADFQYTQAWGDSFDDSSAETLFNRWNPDLMTSGLHQTGNNGRDGARHAAEYSKPQESSFIYKDSLRMRAHVEDGPNPYRKPYTFRGEVMHPENYFIFLSFLTTWARVYDNATDGFITDPNAPDRTWGPGTVLEFEFELDLMRTQACRISFYLLPAYENDSNAYSPDGTRGVENDLTEIDFLDGFENFSQSKVISSLAGGNTPASSVNLNDIIEDLDLQSGTHTLTLLWQKDKFVWYCDGIEIIRDEDPRRIPQTAHYLVISREANSGIKQQRNDGVVDDGNSAYSDGPLTPEDVGIWARPVYAEIENLHNDTAKVLSFNSWSFNDTSVAGVGIGDDTSGISPVLAGPNPPEVFVSGTTYNFNFSDNGRNMSDWYAEFGTTRGGNELGSHYQAGSTRNATFQPGSDDDEDYRYEGPVNLRLWFREDLNSVWHWRDFGFQHGLLPYRTGTDGKVRVTVPASEGYIPTPPTVAGAGWVGPGRGRDGTFASTIDYSNGVVPAGYSEEYTPNAVSVVGARPIDYAATGSPTLPAIRTGVLTYSQYPSRTGELFWRTPADYDPSLHEYEVVINDLVVFRGQGNSFFVEGQPVSDTHMASVRVVNSSGGYGVAQSITFSMVVV